MAGIAGQRGFNAALTVSAALLAVAAGVIHFAVAPEHVREAFVFGVFMVGVGAAQVVAGLLLVRRPSRALIVAIALGTVAVFAVYAVSRTTGLPFGPHAGEPEHVAAIDVLSKGTELALLSLLVLLLRADHHKDANRRARRTDAAASPAGSVYPR